MLLTTIRDSQVFGVAVSGRGGYLLVTETVGQELFVLLGQKAFEPVEVHQSRYSYNNNNKELLNATLVILSQRGH